MGNSLETYFNRSGDEKASLEIPVYESIWGIYWGNFSYIKKQKQA